MRRQYKNPFIKTKAEITLEQSIRDYRIWFHLLEEGEPVGDGFSSITKLARSVYLALDSAEPDARKLKSALNVFEDMKITGTWKAANLQTVNNAMNIITERFHSLPRQKMAIAIVEALA